LIRNVEEKSGGISEIPPPDIKIADVIIPETGISGSFLLRP
jgi:hypothetical protein